MHRFLLASAFAIIALASSVFADGRVTTTAPQPDHWRIGGVTFNLGGDAPEANVFVEYLLPDNHVDHAEGLHITGADRLGLLAATQTSSGSDEASLTLANGDGTTRQDLDAVLVLRISRYLIAHGYLTGVTAVPTSSAGGAQ